MKSLLLLSTFAVALAATLCRAAELDAKTEALLAEVDATFTANGRQISPKLIRVFEPWLSDRNIVVTQVSLTTAMGSNQFGLHGTKRFGPPDFPGPARFQWSIPEDEPGGPMTFLYEYVGRLDGGTHVLRTTVNDGGSGWFDSVIFVRARAIELGGDGWHVVLEPRGGFPIGDRSERPITIEGDHAVVGPSAESAMPQRRIEKREELRPW